MEQPIYTLYFQCHRYIIANELCSYDAMIKNEA